MEEGECPYIVKNEHLFKALVFRKNKDYSNMYKELVVACQEGDEEALVFAYEVYERHGYDTKKYPELVKIFETYGPNEYYEGNNFSDLEKLVATKNIIASYALCFFEIDGFDAFSTILLEHIKQCQKWNDCFALCRNPRSIEDLQCAFDQGYEPARVQLEQRYAKKREYVKAARLIVGAFDTSDIYFWISNALVNYCKSEREQQAFIFGRWLSTRSESRRLDAIFVPCFTVYNQTIAKVKQALSCWLIICKRRIFPAYRDLIKLIGNLVWESRENTELWGITLKRKGPAREAKKIKI